MLARYAPENPKEEKSCREGCYHGRQTSPAEINIDTLSDEAYVV
jgi:hypothetical protein